MKFTLNSTPAPEFATDCLVIGIIEDKPLTGSAQLVNSASNGELARLIETGDVSSDWKDTTMLHGLEGCAAKRILVVGFGEPEKFDRTRYDQACFSAGEFLRNHIVTSAHVCLHEAEIEASRSDDFDWRLRQAAVSLNRANYRYTATKPPKDHDNDPMEQYSFNADSSHQAVIDEAGGLCRAYLRAAELGNLPPNICNPGYLASTAEEIASRFDKASVEILDEAQMAALKMSALLAVGNGSENGSKLIILRYQGGDEDGKPVVLVGKGITFDTGGISLKPGPNMEQMKFDMGGAASVLGAFEACASMGLPINLVCIVAAAENMPDGKSYRPGDVLTSMSGKTIEVLNTDAEGRLILCDALTYAQRFEPAALVDVATLTGAAVVALGHHASAIMSKHDDLADELLAAGQQVIDRGWRLPIWEDYQPQLKSTFADMKNVGGMPAGSITAACFLSRFTQGQRWAHIDCAGSTWVWGSDKSSTGRPAGLLTQFLINQAARG
jgi:leucyl aminopeptidase